MWNQKVRAIILTGITCLFAVGITPVRSQEQPEQSEIEEKQIEESSAEEFLPTPLGDPQVATTTKEVDIPTDELQLIVKPLTLEELQDEAAGWMLLLKTKAQEISQAEVAIKRQNLAITKKEEGAKALEEAQKDLEEAEKIQGAATPGSPEYEEAVKKVEEAQENFKKAQESVEEAQVVQKELKEDEALKDALEKAEETGDLDQAQQTLDEINQKRDAMVAGSLDYEKATGKIEKLEGIIKAVEDAQEEQNGAPPDSPEYQEATQKLNEAQTALKQLLKELGVNTTEEPTKKSSQKLEEATTALENTEITNNEDKKVVGPPEIVDSKEQLEQKQQELEETTEKLENSAEAESEAKNQLVTTVTELQAQQTAIIDRFNIILDELEKKGGKVESYRKYIQAVSSIEIDAKDTEGLGLRLFGWAKSEEGGLRWFNNTSKFLGVFVLSIIIAQILGIFLNQTLSKFGTSLLLRRFIVMVIKRGGVIIGFLVALTALGVSLGPVLALMGGVSFVLAFALQSNLGNLASGLMIMAYKPFDVGDEIKVSEIWGIVDSITIANTKIQGFDGQLFAIPNNAVWGDIIENLSHDEIRKFKIWLRVELDEDLAKIEQLLVKIVKSHSRVLEQPVPKTMVWEIADYYISVTVEGQVKKEDFWVVYPDIIRMIQEQFTRDGLKLAAIPKQIELEEDSNDNGEMPYLVKSSVEATDAES